MINEDFKEGNKAFESGKYYQAIRHYTNAIDSLKGTKKLNNYYGGKYQNIETNLITFYQNRALTYLKLQLKNGGQNYKKKAIEDLGEVVELYRDLGDRVRAFETVEEIRGLGGTNNYNY